MSTQRRARQASVGLVVVGLHLVGLLLWWMAERGMQMVRSDTRRASIAVWLPALSPLEARHAKPPSRQIPKQPPAPESPSLHRPRDSSPTEASTATAVPATDGLPVPEETRRTADAPSETATAPTLNLNLTRKAITSVAPPSFAEQSPFRGRLPATVERQIAGAAAATGPWTEERIDNDRIRFRRGNTCVTMQRPRAASIDPFSEAAARIPWRAGQPETCE